MRGASGPAFSQAMREVGVIRDSPVPGESLLYRMFDLIGETRPAMLLTRQAARLAKGWEADAVREAGRIAAERLVDRGPALRPAPHRGAPPRPAARW